MLKQLVSGNEDTFVNKTLYCKNLNDKVNKKDLRVILYELFIQYGTILKIIVKGGCNNRGQAFVLFDNLNSAIEALNNVNGRVILGKPIVIEYAKKDSKVPSTN
ncbi:RNA recognition motif. family protein [Cryptosporidium muris RN66]|uniref:RNA recognition motif. family protein n=1 Tax=Cryptosporidium muris (strain RN66) TaxID=441375 RepID=B6ACB7_CRYMR|nr:RNA recognition motif. family protein [Cryptosporidium muris RN66]EEA06173.1 RNA recognition motif. family protein [Cryptosporidium muris RN66]|eukprot:XP_002140522.1 RNA recognition motif. family protein [Cryptosporidium muris RN66]